MSDQLKNKLEQFEVLPPPGVWDSIASELKDANPLLSLSQKMYDHELSPPTMAWNNIKSALPLLPGGENEAPIRSIKKPLYKLTVAATILGVVLLGSLYLYNNNIIKKSLFANQRLGS